MTPWTPETVEAWARQHLPQPFFISRDVCAAAARAEGGGPAGWSRGQGILAALRRFGLVERRPVRLSWKSKRPVLFEYWLVNQAQAEAERDRDAAEARRLLGIDEPVADLDPSGYGWGV